MTCLFHLRVHRQPTTENEQLLLLPQVDKMHTAQSPAGTEKDKETTENTEHAENRLISCANSAPSVVANVVVKK